MRLIDCDRINSDRFWLDDNVLVMAVSEIDNAPTIDAVNVVRCKDCYFVNCYDELLPRYEYARMLSSFQVNQMIIVATGNTKATFE